MSESNKNAEPKGSDFKLVSTPVRGSAYQRLPNLNLSNTNEGHVVPDAPVAPEALAEEIKELAKYKIPHKNSK